MCLKPSGSKWNTSTCVQTTVALSCFLVSWATFVIWKNCVQNKPETAFSLFSYFYNVKKWGSYCFVYSAVFLVQKHVLQTKMGCFLVYSSTFVIRKHVCTNQAGWMLFSLSIISEYYTPKMLLLRMWKILFKMLLLFSVFSKLYKTYADGPFLVYVLLIIT